MAEMTLERKYILVTGAAGLIASAVVEKLLVYYPTAEVYAMVRDEQKALQRFEKYLCNPHLHILTGDVNAPLAVETNFHYIIHAAGNANPNAYATHPVETLWTNINGTRNLLEYGRTHGIERFLYVSSGEVYGNGEQTEWVEDDSGKVDTMTLRACYPSSKRAAETMCVCYAEQYGIDVVVGRPCHTYGPHFTEADNRAFAQFVRKARAREDIVLKSTGEQYRSWIFVEDCADALLTILQKGACKQAYNIADQQSNVTIRTLAETIADIAGVKVVFDLPSATESKGYSAMKRAVFNTERLCALGWTPRFSLTRGLIETIKGTK
ncbi:MAG: NAD-dependent epimerase/dehydratase family protein [Paludibacteraceae bacterium]